MQQPPGRLLQHSPHAEDVPRTLTFITHQELEAKVCSCGGCLHPEHPGHEFQAQTLILNAFVSDARWFKGRLAATGSLHRLYHISVGLGRTCAGKTEDLKVCAFENLHFETGFDIVRNKKGSEAAQGQANSKM